MWDLEVEVRRRLAEASGDARGRGAVVRAEPAGRTRVDVRVRLPAPSRGGHRPRVAARSRSSADSSSTRAETGGSLRAIDPVAGGFGPGEERGPAVRIVAGRRRGVGQPARRARRGRRVASPAAAARDPVAVEPSCRRSAAPSATRTGRPAGHVPASEVPRRGHVRPGAMAGARPDVARAAAQRPRSSRPGRAAERPRGGGHAVPGAAGGGPSAHRCEPPGGQGRASPAARPGRPAGTGCAARLRVDRAQFDGTSTALCPTAAVAGGRRLAARRGRHRPSACRQDPPRRRRRSSRRPTRPGMAATRRRRARPRSARGPAPSCVLGRAASESTDPAVAELDGESPHTGRSGRRRARRGRQDAGSGRPRARDAQPVADHPGRPAQALEPGHRVAEPEPAILAAAEPRPSASDSRRIRRSPSASRPLNPTDSRIVPLVVGVPVVVDDQRALAARPDDSSRRRRPR